MKSGTPSAPQQLDTGLLLAALDHADIGVFITDAQGNVLHLNAWVEKYAGIPAQVSVGRNLLSLFPQLERTRIMPALVDALQFGLPAYLSQLFNPTPFPFRKGPGQPLMEQLIHVTPLEYQSGQRCALVTVVDVSVSATQRKALAQKAEDLQQQVMMRSRNNRMLMTMMQGARDAVISFDNEGELISANKAAQQLLLLPNEALANQNIAQFLPELGGGDSDLNAQLKRLDLLSEGGQTSWREMALVCADGTWRMVEISLCRVAWSETIEHLALLHDITEEKQQRALIHQQRELAQITLNAIGDAVLTTDASGCIKWANSAAAHLFNLSDRALGQPLHEVLKVHRGSQPLDGMAILDEAILASSPLQLTMEDDFCLHTSSQTTMYVQGTVSPLRDENSDLLGFVLVLRDCSQQRRETRRLSWEASHDSLTGLLNRSEMLSTMRRVVARCQEGHENAVLLYLDLDRFKQVNDQGGHAAGDELLRQLGQLLREHLRSSDEVARMGGDEFAILLRFCEPSDGEVIARQICDSIVGYRFHWQERVFSVGASLGLLPLSGEENDVAQLLLMADAACFQAKEAGRGQVKTWHGSHGISEAGATDWGQVLSSITDGEVRQMLLRSQPAEAPHIADASPLHEVYVRLLDANQQEVLPGAFLPAAERYQLMSRLDQAIAHQTLTILTRSARRDGNACFAFNVATETMKSCALPGYLSETLPRFGIAPSCLFFELPEEGVLEQPTPSVKFAQALKKMGCRVGIDHFSGTLAHGQLLRRLAPDYIKLNQNLVHNVLESEADREVLRFLVRFCDVLNIQLIACFVDSQALLEALENLGIRWFQGYHIARPQPLEVG